MNQYQHSKSSLFLMEIILNIFFFAILVTICLQMFFKAHTLSTKTEVLHRAVTTCTSIAEVYQNGSGETEALQTIYPDSVSLNDSLLIYFDEKYAACSKQDAFYRAYITFRNDSLYNADITFCTIDNTDAIYELSVSAYHSATPAMLGGETHE